MPGVLGTSSGMTQAPAFELSGLDFLRSIVSKASPPAPIQDTLGFQLVEVDPGRVVFELEPAPFHYNPIGTVHGGVLATLCDSAASAAVHSKLPVGVGYTTLEIKVSFLRAVTVATGRLRCEGTVLSEGSRVMTSQARLLDADGRACGHATATCLLLR